MVLHKKLSNHELRVYIKNGELTLAGNQKLKIYGQLNCTSGKRMKKENRVFFQNEAEAIRNDFRPCAHCQKAKYQEWLKNK